MPHESRPTRKLLRIILDSNAFFIPLQFKIDIFEELKRLLNVRYEVILLPPVQRELQAMAQEGSPKRKRYALYALGLAEKCKLIELDEEYADSTPDDIILNIAHKWKCIVFTNDKELRKKLRDINVPVIYVRQKSRLEIEGRI